MSHILASHRAHRTTFKDTTMAVAKDIYLVRHGESTYNQWRKQSYATCFCTCMMGHCCDPLIRDAPLSTNGENQVQMDHNSGTTTRSNVAAAPIAPES